MKTTIKTAFTAILLLAVSCTKEKMFNTSSVAVQTKNNAVAKLHIGDTLGGGIIFYIDTSGQHGFIAAFQDQGTAIVWWNGVNTVTGAIQTVIGTGKSNTQKIIQSQGKPGTYAALLCKKYKGGGYTDWFLPSRDELNELYKQKKWVGGFASAYYWTSSEFDSSSSWGVNFYDGYQRHGLYKYFTYYVRAVRAF
jgi:hypothetical protein